MSLITPAGKNSFDWSPKQDGELVKKASTGKKTVVKSDRDLLYDAARKALRTAQSFEEDVELVDEVPVDEFSEGDVQEGELEDVVDEVEEVEEVAEEDTVEEALEEASAALDKAKQAIDDAKSVAGVEEVDIDLDTGDVDIVEPEEEPEEVSIDINLEDEDFGEDVGEDVEDEGLMVETNEEEGTEEDLQVSASSNEFCTFAKISPENRKKIYTFWANDLGYPKDYCNLLVKDYEK